jgi:hypothetical protein
MQALDRFISSIPGFEGDIPITTIPVLTQYPGDESINDTSARASTSALKTPTGMRKATANSTPQKKAKKAMGKPSSGIKINGPAPKAPAPTPPSSPRQRIPIHWSNMFTHHDFFILDYFVTCAPLCSMPQDINPDSSTKGTPASVESPKEDKPMNPHAKKTMLESPKPPSPRGTQGSPSASGAPSSPTQAASGSNLMGASSAPEPTESPKASPPSPRSYGLGVTGGYQPGEGSSAPQSKRQPQQYSWVTDSLCENPKFIQAGSTSACLSQRLLIPLQTKRTSRHSTPI